MTFGVTAHYAGVGGAARGNGTGGAASALIISAPPQHFPGKFLNVTKINAEKLPRISFGRGHPERELPDMMSASLVMEKRV